MVVKKRLSPIVPADYEKTKEIFSAVLELEPGERALFLAENCADENVRREVESLLRARNEAADFLNDVSAVKIIQDSFERRDKLIGQKVDKYRIEREIGRGGMGVVYLAVREDFHQQAALKLIKRGMDSDAILERFTREREILASLNHPYIARLLDGGTTTEGTPFFVMEYVEGVSVDEYCRDNNLSEKEKLELFRKICEAVSFAHQKLVVHRDLKPSNILVTEDGTPKLLDFGIAKLLNSTVPDNTQTNQRVLTPAFASPEQMRGEMVGTASDVYSLGLILAQMLEVQSSRFQVESFPRSGISGLSSEADSGRQTKDEDQRSKTKDRNLNRDLQNILLMSLREDAARRYGSVEALSADIRRYLEGLPVAARKDSFAYRAEKFIKRHKIPVAAAALVLLTLVGGILAVWRQAKIAERERERAERRAENLRKLSSSFVTELHGAILNLPGSLAARQLLLTRAVEQLDALAAESEGNPQLQDELAQGYYNLGEMPAIKMADAERNYQKAISIYQKLLADNASNVHYRRQLAKGFSLLGDLQKVRGLFAESLSFRQQSNAILESIIAELPTPEARHELWDSYLNTETDLYFMGEAQKSLEYGRRAFVLSEELLRQAPDDPEYRRMVFNSRAAMVKSLEYLGDYQAALSELHLSIDECQKAAAVNPNDVRYRYDLWALNRRWGKILDQTGERSAALEKLETALEIMENLRRTSPDDNGYQRNTAFTNLSLGQTLIRLRQPAKALPYLRLALELSEKLIAADPERGETLEDLGGIHGCLGHALTLLGQRSEGLQHFRQAVGYYEKLLEHDGQNAILRRDFAEILAQAGDALRKGADPGERRQTRDFLQRSFEIWQDLQNKGILSKTDAEQPKLAAQNLWQFDAAVSK